MATEVKKDIAPDVQFSDLCDCALVRAEVLLRANLLPFSKATLWRMVRAGSFPAPVKLSSNITAWQVGTIRRWLADLAPEAS